MANIVDRLIGWLNPRAGLSRHFHRKQLERAYDAASPRDRWRPRRAGASANADFQADGKILRDKARSLVQNVPYIAGGLEALVSATVGTGITPRGTGKEADKTNAVFAEWSKVCDADGRLDFNGIIAGAYAAMEQDGEVLIRVRPRYASDGLPVPLQLQLLEIDWLDTTRTTTIGGNRVINGIEYDVLGDIAAYWLWENHPGDVNVFTALRTQSKRIDAKNIIHLFNPQRPGQGRGFTRFAPVIATVRDLQLYEDAELARKNLETRLGVLYSGDPTQMANPAGNGEAPKTDAGQLGDLPSGAMTALPAGSSVTVVAPTVAAGYVEYVKQKLKMIAIGMGVTYEMLTGDMSEVNFSSARVRLLDFRRSVERVRWLVLMPKLLSPIWQAFIDAGVLGGQFRQADYAVDFSVPKWDYVNPLQDVQAEALEISLGLGSISEKLRQRGYEPGDVFAEIKADFDKLRELGVMDILLFKETKKPVNGADPNAAAAASDAVDAAAETARAIAEVMAMVRRVSEDVAKLMTRETTINLRTGDTKVDVPERSVTVEGAQQTINVEPAVVKNEIRNEGATINVPAAEPVVNVSAAAPEIRLEVQPTPVMVNVPTRNTVTDVERDGQGRITRTTQRDK